MKKSVKSQLTKPPVDKHADKPVDNQALLDCQKELDETKAQLQRALADYANLRLRVEKEQEAVLAYANEQLLTDILPILDILHKGFESTKDPHLKASYDYVLGVLTGMGVRVIDAQGQTFDPQLHEAVDRTDDGNDVVRVYEQGFLWKDKVLKPARVSVGYFKNAPQQGAQNEDKMKEEGENHE